MVLLQGGPSSTSLNMSRAGPWPCREGGVRTRAGVLNKGGAGGGGGAGPCTE